MDLQSYLLALALILGVAVAAWVVSVMIRNVAFVDSLWSLFFLIAAVVFAVQAAPLSARGLLVTLLVAIWALRLCLHITARNWGEPEDYRYRKIRENNEPGFAFKSLYIVFGLQGLLAWFIAMPLIPAIMNPGGIGPLERPLPRATLRLQGRPTANADEEGGALVEARRSRRTSRTRAACLTRASGATRGIRIISAISASGGRFICSLSLREAGGPWRRRC